MLGIILFLPTIIVVLPKSNHKEITNAVEVTSEVEKDDAIDMTDVTIAVQRTNTGEIERVPLEKYIVSVVASEMPVDFEIEALKAQAIAARTYVVNHLLRHESDEEFVITDSTDHQVYKNEDELKVQWGNDYQWKMEKIQKAVKETQNEIITYDSEPITPTFFSMSNGYTEAAENYWGTALPYLKSVESKWEVNHPKFTEQYIFTIDEISEKLNIPLSSNQTVPIQIKRTESNRVDEISFAGHSFSGRDVREKLQLRSNDFNIQQKNNHLIFTTKGYGHGVGMSQYGANGMAQEGKNYREILTHYYQGIEISTINDAAPALVAKNEK